MPDRSDEPGLQRILCEECKTYPQAYWDSEIGTIALVCSCGERLVPRDAVLEQDMMSRGVSWTVREGDGNDE